MKMIDEWQGLANLLSDLITKYASVLDESYPNSQNQKIDPPAENTIADDNVA
jgi:hypothetical protein